MDRQTVIAFAIVALLVAGRTAAQESASPEPDLRPLYEQEPFDRLTLNDKERLTLRLVPLAPADRQPAAPRKPTDVLRVRLFDKPDEPYDVAWSNVAELRLFEQLILDEAIQQTATGKFAAAFDTFLFLRREHPKLAGLEEAETALLIAEAKAALAADHIEDAQVRIVRLIQRNDRHPELADLAATTTERLLQIYLKSPRPAAARPTLNRFSAKFPQHAAIAKLRQLLSAAADERLNSARQALADKRYVAAQQAAEAAAMLAVDAGPALELYRRAIEAYPAVIVGVVETVSEPSTIRTQAVESWAERRTARLNQVPTLEAMVTTGPPPTVTYGGAGRWTADDRDPLAFRLQLSSGPQAATAAETAAALFAAGRPTDLELNVIDPRNLELRTSRPHPRLEALIAAETAQSRTVAKLDRAPYSIAEQTDSLSRRVVAAKATGGPAEIGERRFADEEDALKALLAGEIDVVDRLAPWQVAAVMARRELQLTRYAAAGVHLLTFNPAQPLLRRPEFRRAVQYAVDREAILRNHLRPPKDDLGSRRSDGLFAIGRSADDPLGYAYDLSVPPQTYDPQRAYLLAALARSANPNDDLGTPKRPLILRHPATATATIACRRIATYLHAVGIAVEPQAAPPDRTPGNLLAADMTYLVVASLEPLVDAPRLLQPSMLIDSENLVLQRSLRLLSAAETFATARAALFEIQRTVRDEALVVPLWQLSEYAASRSRVKIAPPGRAPTALYQYVDQWQIEPHYNEPLP